MTQKEVRKILLTVKSKEWFKKLSLNISLQHIDFAVTCNGFGSIYQVR